MFLNNHAGRSSQPAAVRLTLLCTLCSWGYHLYTIWHFLILIRSIDSQDAIQCSIMQLGAQHM